MTSTDLTTPDDRTMDERARDMTITPPSGSGNTNALVVSRVIDALKADAQAPQQESGQ